MRSVDGLLALALTAASFLPANLAVAAPASGEWLKGDLHVHSRHSSDSSNHPVGTIVRFAEEIGFDFLAITDHDKHVDGAVADNTWADPEWRSEGLILLYAAEWTTDRGHGNVFAARPFDQRRLYRIRDARDSQLLATKREMGVHLSANHPTNKDHFGFSYDLPDSIEVWNSSNWAKNVPSLVVWDDMLKSGRRLPGRGGSDAHHGWPETPTARTSGSNLRLANYIGTPTTWVFARTHDRQGVIEALGAGHSSISASPFAPRVELAVDVDADGKSDGMMGDNLAASGKPVSFQVRLAGGTVPWAEYSVRVIRDGELFTTLTITAEKPEGGFSDAPPAAKRSYYRLEVEGPQSPYPQVPMAAGITGAMVALSNPIFFNFDPDF